MITKNIEHIHNTIINLSIKHIPEKKDDSSLVSLAREVFKIAELFASQNVCKSEIAEMDCQAGCSICCRVTVPVLLPEALIIADFIKNKFSKNEIRNLLAKMEEMLPQIKYLEEDERILSNKECAFLDKEGACSIYEVRPLMCRSVTSADSEACRQAMTMLAMNEHVFVPMNIMQKSIMDTAFKALAKGLKQCRIDNKSKELTEAVYDLIKNI